MVTAVVFILIACTVALFSIPIRECSVSIAGCFIDKAVAAVSSGSVFLKCVAAGKVATAYTEIREILFTQSCITGRCLTLTCTILVDEEVFEFAGLNFALALAGVVVEFLSVSANFNNGA